MNKRGISAIVATVLIILITVASVTIVWTAIIPMVQQNLEFSELEGRVSIVTSGGYTSYDIDKKLAMVQVKRDVDDRVMERIRITFSFNGSSFSSLVPAPDSGLTKVYTFNLSEYGKPNSVSVVPIFVVGNMEKEGSVTSKIDIVEGVIIDVASIIYELGEDYEIIRKSCLKILDAGKSTGDGFYDILIGEEVVSVYCDMTTDGGGWTLIARTGMVCDSSFGWNYITGSLDNLSECYSLGVGVRIIDFEEIMWGINSGNFEWGEYVYKTPMNNEYLVTYANSLSNCSMPIPIKGGNTENSMQCRGGYTSRDNIYFMRDCCYFMNFGLSGTRFRSAWCDEARSGYMCNEKAMLFIK
ncbi:hypothetical protein KAI32_03590 [Candidatus Pacearchaeota archaeon]|nr:hypothetical protein [Candidatus Pacearchaeota archaeon]